MYTIHILQIHTLLLQSSVHFFMFLKEQYVHQGCINFCSGCHSILQASHGPSENIIICWFDAPAIFHVIITPFFTALWSMSLFEEQHLFEIKTFCNIINLSSLSFLFTLMHWFSRCLCLEWLTVLGFGQGLNSDWMFYRPNPLITPQPVIYRGI